MRTRPVFMRMLGTALAIGATARSAALEPVAKGAELRAQYGTQGFFMSQPMAVENESVTFHARATGAGPEPAGRLVIEDSAGAVVQEAPLAFTRDGERFAAEVTWKPARNGMYTAEASLTADGYVFENTQAKSLQLLAPVIVKGRMLTDRSFDFRGVLGGTTHLLIVQSPGHQGTDDLRLLRVLTRHIGLHFHLQRGVAVADADRFSGAPKTHPRRRLVDIPAG